MGAITGAEPRPTPENGQSRRRSGRRRLERALRYVADLSSILLVIVDRLAQMRERWHASEPPKESAPSSARRKTVASIVATLVLVGVSITLKLLV